MILAVEDDEIIEKETMIVTLFRELILSYPDGKRMIEEGVWVDDVGILYTPNQGISWVVYITKCYDQELIKKFRSLLRERLESNVIVGVIDGV